MCIPSPSQRSSYTQRLNDKKKLRPPQKNKIHKHRFPPPKNRTAHQFSPIPQTKTTVAPKNIPKKHPKKTSPEKHPKKTSQNPPKAPGFVFHPIRRRGISGSQHRRGRGQLPDHGNRRRQELRRPLQQTDAAAAQGQVALSGPGSRMTGEGHVGFLWDEQR